MHPVIGNSELFEERLYQQATPKKLSDSNYMCHVTVLKIPEFGVFQVETVPSLIKSVAAKNAGE